MQPLEDLEYYAWGLPRASGSTTIRTPRCYRGTAVFERCRATGGLTMGRRAFIPRFGGSHLLVWIAVLLPTLPAVAQTQSASEVVYRPLAATPPGTTGLSEGWNAIKEFPLPNAGSNPTAITLGPDGAMWFVENATSSPGRIGRIDTTAGLTEFPLTNCCSGPQAGITVGPDGALWFTQPFTGIGRITTAGIITQYFPATCCIYPQGITAGPDGALWFSDSSGGKIGRITTAGVITEFP